LINRICSVEPGKEMGIYVIRGILMFLLLLAEMYGSEKNPSASGMAELYADRFESRDGTAYAYGHVVLSYDGTVFLGDFARYDQEKNVIVVEGDVKIISERGNKIMADKVVFKVNDNHVVFSDFYHTDREDIWMYAAKAEKKDGNYTLHNSILSSCSPERPDWSVKFGEAVYDSRQKYMRLKNVKIYARETPVFYTPYLGFSLERERNSGFLMPHLGYGGDEGFYYEQPYFWAISRSMDMEFNPSVRTERGYGIYGTFRFADSPWSGGIVRGGYFYDKRSFRKEHNLANRSHYGMEFLYESSNVLKDWKPEGYRDGLYVNIDYFNDVDYHNLQFSSLDHLEETTKYKESRINYFLYNDSQYFGFRSRYFINTQQEDNGDTIQELPALQYHKFSTPLFGGLLDYRVDAQLYNFWRENGTRAIRGVATLPVEFHTSLFGDYLNLSIEEEFSASDTKFFEESSLNVENDHYAAAVLHHKIEFSGDLIRAYENGVHTMLLAATFTKTSRLAEGDLTYEEINDNLVSDYNLDMVYESRLAFSMHHFWESYDGLYKFDYLAVADYYPDDDSNWNQLRQELNFQYSRFIFSSRIDYSIQHGSLSQLASTFTYDGEAFAVSLEHTRKENEWDQTLDQHELGLNARYRQNDMLSWYGAYTYDFKENGSKDWKAGVLVDRKCWNFKVVFEQDITPVLKKDGGGSIRNNAVYFQFNLVPFGGVGSGGHTTL